MTPPATASTAPGPGRLAKDRAAQAERGDDQSSASGRRLGAVREQRRDAPDGDAPVEGRQHAGAHLHAATSARWRGAPRVGAQVSYRLVAARDR